MYKNNRVYCYCKLSLRLRLSFMNTNNLGAAPSSTAAGLAGVLFLIYE